MNKKYNFDNRYDFFSALPAILMLVDIPQERGMARIDARFGNPNICHFPLFNFLQPLPVDWMYLVYLIMVIGKYFPKFQGKKFFLSRLY